MTSFLFRTCIEKPRASMYSKPYSSLEGIDRNFTHRPIRVRNCLFFGVMLHCSSGEI